MRVGVPSAAKALPLAVGLLLSTAAPAGADAITYTEGGNVWIASPDGGVKKQLTTDGVPGGVRYYGPSQADNGTIAVIYGAGLGAGSGTQIQVLGADGAVQRTGPLQLRTCGAFGQLPTSFGATRIDPRGEVIAHEYMCTNIGSGTAGTTVTTALTSAASPGVIMDELRAVGSYRPSWLTTRAPGAAANDMLLTDQYGRWLETLAWRLPLEAVEVVNANEGFVLSSASFSRTGNILAYAIGEESTDRSTVYAARMTGDLVPGVGVAAVCAVASSTEPMTPSVSPDGSRVAWSDDGGAKVAAVTVPAGANGEACPGTITTLAAGGINPVFSGAEAPTPPAPNPAPNPGPTPGPKPGPRSTLTVKGPTSATLAQIRKGLNFSTRCNGKCTVKGRMLVGNRQVAADTAKLKRKGTARMVLRAKLKKSVSSVLVVIVSGTGVSSRTVTVRG